MVHKIKNMTTPQIKEEMSRIKKKSIEEYKWLHENKRWVGLLNEYSRRVMKK